MVAKLGVRRRSALLMSASVTGRRVFGFAVSLDVARQARLESEKLTNTPVNMNQTKRNR